MPEDESAEQVEVRDLQLKRIGGARKKLNVWVDGKKVAWRDDDFSELIPLTVGLHDFRYRIWGKEGDEFGILFVKPTDAQGEMTSSIGPVSPVVDETAKVRIPKKPD